MVNKNTFGKITIEGADKLHETMRKIQKELEKEIQKSLLVAAKNLSPSGSTLTAQDLIRAHQMVNSAYGKLPSLIEGWPLMDLDESLFGLMNRDLLDNLYADIGVTFGDIPISLRLIEPKRPHESYRLMVLNDEKVEVAYVEISRREMHDIQTCSRVPRDFYLFVRGLLFPVIDSLLEKDDDDD